jgi:hypothetical protein
VNTRFHVDLLHPGWEIETWRDWFTGARGGRRLALFAAGGAALLLVVLLAGVLPTYWRLSADARVVPELQRQLAARDADLMLLRSNLRALSQEAGRQVRWAELLAMLSRAMPTTLRLELVELARVAPPAAGGQPAGAAARGEEALRIEAVTPLQPGSAPLSDVARLLAALASDPALGRRFELRNWEVKPSTAITPDGEQLLNVGVVLAERPERPE